MDDWAFFGPVKSHREEQKEHTRDLIMGAAIALATRGGEQAVTIRAVARMVGIAERSVHRHFQTRDELIGAVWANLPEFVGRRALPQTAGDLAIEAQRFFSRLGKYRDLVRAYLYSRSRWKARLRIDTARQQAMVACVEEELELLHEDNLRRRAAIIDIIGSPYACELLQETWRLSAEEAGIAAAEAIEILLNRRSAH